MMQPSSENRAPPEKILLELMKILYSDLPPTHPLPTD